MPSSSFIVCFQIFLSLSISLPHLRITYYFPFAYFSSSSVHTPLFLHLVYSSLFVSFASPLVFWGGSLLFSERSSRLLSSRLLSCLLVSVPLPSTLFPLIYARLLLSPLLFSSHLLYHVPVLSLSSSILFFPLIFASPLFLFSSLLFSSLVAGAYSASLSPGLLWWVEAQTSDGKPSQMESTFKLGRKAGLRPPSSITSKSHLLRIGIGSTLFGRLLACAIDLVRARECAPGFATQVLFQKLRKVCVDEFRDNGVYVWQVHG